MTGKRKVRDGIKDAKPGTTGPVKSESVQKYLDTYFKMETDGLYFKCKDAEKPNLRVCDHFEVLYEIRNKTGADGGLYLSWRDREGILHFDTVRFEELNGDGVALRQRLANGRLRVSPNPTAKAALLEFLNAQQPEAFARCVATVGWHHVGGRRIFVTPGRVYGAPSEYIVFQPDDRLPDPFLSSGTLEQWKREIASLCSGNTRLVLAICVALAGPLLDLIGEAGGGINLYGNSTDGKTGTLHAAGSVWGATKGEADTDVVYSWRGTLNAVEANACARNDAFLGFDEMGQIDARALGEVIYLLGNGHGKMRARRDGTARPVTKFRIFYLSSSERPLDGMIAEAGQVAKAGQENRLVDVPADAGAEMGILGQLNGKPTAEAFMLHLSESTRKFHGVAAPAFLDHLISQLGLDDVGYRRKLRDRVTGLCDRWLKERPDAGSQLRRVARRFAIAAVAGEIATDADITGWDKPLAADACRICFEAWVNARGTEGQREEMDAVRQLSDFIMVKSSSRFADVIESGAQVDPGIPTERRPIVKQAGLRFLVKSPDAPANEPLEWVHYLNDAGWKEALKGLDQSAAKKLFVRLGVIQPPGKDGKSSRPVSTPGQRRLRYIRVDNKIHELAAR